MTEPGSGIGGRWSPARFKVVALLGATQIIAWGTTFYLLAVLATPIARDTGWSTTAVVGGLSWSLLFSGLAAPRIGRVIDRYGGRWTLVGGSLLIAAGLTLLGAAPNLAVYYAAWTVLGLGMAAGLYDAAFATIGRLYGSTARPSITGLTLLGGLASTVAWPIIAILEGYLGWRATCFALAAVHGLVSMPLHAFALPKPPPAAVPAAEAVEHESARTPAPAEANRLFFLIAIAFTLYAFISSGLSVHVLEVLRRLGLEVAGAIAIGMVIGPAQVTSRIIEFTMGQRAHPIWTARTGIGLCTIGVVLLLAIGPGAAIAAMAVYGAGNGIMTIARGTLPLALFGPHGYGARIGRIAQPALIAQALAPIALAAVLEHAGASALLGVTAIIALCAAAAFWLIRPGA